MAEEKLEIIVTRIDENVKSIKKEIGEMKKNYNGKMKDHENRIRDNEKFKQRGYGALGLIGAILTVIGGIVVKLMIG